MEKAKVKKCYDTIVIFIYVLGDMSFTIFNIKDKFKSV